MRIKSVCRALIAVTASLVALAGCSAAPGGAGRGGLEKTDIVIDAFPAIDSAGLFIAQQRGLFKAQGLNVTIKLAATSQTAIDGQLKGQFDITSADYVTYVNNVLLNKAPLRIVAESSFLQPNVLTLLTKGGSEVKSVRQLQGKTVSVNAPNDIGTLLIDSLLADYSVPLNSVTFNNDVDFPHVGEYLAQGKVDAAFAPEPFVSLDGMAVGTTELADLDQGGTSDFPIQGVAVTQEMGARQPAHPRRLRACLRPGTGDRPHRAHRGRVRPQAVPRHATARRRARLAAQLPRRRELGPAAAPGRRHGQVRPAQAGVQRLQDQVRHRQLNRAYLVVPGDRSKDSSRCPPSGPMP